MRVRVCVGGGGDLCVWLLPSPCLLSEAPHVVDRGEGGERGRMYVCVVVT